MTALNAVLGRVADAVLGPVQGWPPLAVILALALVTALVVLGVMKVSSNQTKMAAAKRRIHADLLEMRLYNDDLRALLRAQGALLRDNGAYLWLSLVPLLITALPLTLAHRPGAELVRLRRPARRPAGAGHDRPAGRCARRPAHPRCAGGRGRGPGHVLPDARPGGVAGDAASRRPARGARAPGRRRDAGQDPACRGRHRPAVSGARGARPA